MSDELVLNRIIPLVFLLGGLGLLVAATVHVIRIRAFLAGAAEATGEVVALEQEPATEAGELPTHRPVVSFRAGTTRVQFKSMAHSSPPEYEVGASVRVLYDPAHPGEAKIHSFTGLWMLAVILGGLGVIFTALAVGLLLAFLAV